MSKELTQGFLWNKAATDGLVLGAMTVIFTLLGSLAPKLGAIAGGFAGFFLTIGKIVACVLLFKFFLKRIGSRTGAPARTLYTYGLRIAICSSLLVAAYSLFASLQVSPEEYLAQIDEALATSPVKLDSNTMGAMESFLPKLPAINFFTTLVYCFIWGWVLSAVFSKSEGRSDPFADAGPDWKARD